MSIDDATKRRLLSIANLWLEEVDLLNGKAVRSRMRSAGSLQQGSNAGYEVPLWSQADIDLLTALRTLYGIDGALLHAKLVYMTVVDVHLLTLALEHVFQCLGHLTASLSPDAAVAADRFRAAWGSVRDVRNALEHEEEYVAGGGQRPKLVDPVWVPPTMGASRQLRTSDAGLDAVSVLGKWYQVGESISAAHALRPLLLAETDRIASRATGLS
jgi:hypothetical protein